MTNKSRHTPRLKSITPMPSIKLARENERFISLGEHLSLISKSTGREQLEKWLKDKDNAEIISQIYDELVKSAESGENFLSIEVDRKFNYNMIREWAEQNQIKIELVGNLYDPCSEKRYFSICFNW